MAYLLELQDAAGEVTFAMAAMDAFSANSDDVVLTAEPGARHVRQPVANLTVRTNSSAVNGATGSPNGFVEFYNCTYSAKRMSTPAGGGDNAYDYNDTPTNIGKFGYGCLQVHDLGAKRTVLAFNHFNTTARPCDVGIGTNPDTRGNPDWTFAANADKYTARRISVWVK